MNGLAEIDLKRLFYRCRHRGTKEMDLLLGGFAERHLEALSPAQAARLERLLAVEEPVLYAWIVGLEPVPPEHDHDVMAWLRSESLSRP